MAYDISVTFNNDKETGESRDLSWNGKDQKPINLADTRKVAEKANTVSSGLLFNAGKQVVMGMIGRYGNYTGDFMTTNKLNAAMNIGQMAAAVLTGNPIAIAQVTIDTAFKMADYSMMVTKSNKEAENIQNLAGISAVSRSRGSGGKV